MSKKKNLAPIHNTNTKVIYYHDIRNLENNRNISIIDQDVRNLENNKNISSQENTSTLVKNVSKKRNSVLKQTCNTNTKVIN
ncbi:17697_t:CDS:2 [Dentiscutata erythropus]|uniref:17697_t:CDS:1 n=1 Tax=Dentiscutata erythropus TaxID=1348616 RepID=A0A9N9B1T4_9GLOM|nr:17697_t:CDS:2 [Dentiscutata erythropus]